MSVDFVELRIETTVASARDWVSGEGASASGAVHGVGAAGWWCSRRGRAVAQATHPITLYSSQRTDQKSGTDLGLAAVAVLAVRRFPESLPQRGPSIAPLQQPTNSTLLGALVLQLLRRCARVGRVQVRRQHTVLVVLVHVEPAPGSFCHRSRSRSGFAYEGELRGERPSAMSPLAEPEMRWHSHDAVSSRSQSAQHNIEDLAVVYGRPDQHR